VAAPAASGLDRVLETPSNHVTGVVTERRTSMAMEQGEKYECPDPECRCQISVTRRSEAPDADQAPRCSCGEEMILMEDMRRSAGGR
jgi:hypothetical protein